MTGDEISNGLNELTEEMRLWEKDSIEPALMSAVFENCCGILGNNPTGHEVSEAVATAVAITEQVWSDIENESLAPACEKGCAWCCHQTVMVIAPEVIFLAGQVDRLFDTAKRSELRARLGRQRKLIEGKTTADRQTNSFACGVLVDGECSVHQGRPLLCRGAFSSDAGFCRHLFENFVEVIAAIDSGAREEKFLHTPKILFDSAQLGLSKAFQKLGYKCPPLELTAALDIALSLPDVGDVWLGEESIFAPAALTKIGNYYVTSSS